MRKGSGWADPPPPLSEATVGLMNGSEPGRPSRRGRQVDVVRPHPGQGTVCRGRRGMLSSNTLQRIRKTTVKNVVDSCWSTTPFPHFYSQKMCSRMKDPVTLFTVPHFGTFNPFFWQGSWK